MSEQHDCPVCGGPMSPLHKEVTIRLGQPQRVQHRRRCLDLGCGGSTLEDEEWQGLRPDDH